ncbi:hypothetical protein B0A48_11628 [Cryoendolithus antarcticus]|uniref:F-box domain-containing protein n=1 Tax=Cryoendolithus antarcticus TaxID=1507870 RepID=A0A1V8SWD2_9PEZI|nr:hypothetical protein B0A48_11628 [Cryoendolithus antarcticus]
MHTTGQSSDSNSIPQSTFDLPIQQQQQRPRLPLHRPHTVHSSRTFGSQPEQHQHVSDHSRNGLHMLADAASQRSYDTIGRAALAREAAADAQAWENTRALAAFLRNTGPEPHFQTEEIRNTFWRNQRRQRRPFVRQLGTASSASSSSHASSTNSLYSPSLSSVGSSANAWLDANTFTMSSTPSGIGSGSSMFSAASTVSSDASLTACIAGTSNEESARRGSTARRLSKKVSDFGRNMMTNDMASFGVKTRKPSSNEGMLLTIDPSNITKKATQPTSPTKRNVKYDDNSRNKKFRPALLGGISSNDRKDTPAPAHGQPARSVPPYFNPSGGEGARQFAARHKQLTGDVQMDLDFYDDLNSRRSRVGSISSAADSGADLSQYDRFDSPCRDFDGDIDMPVYADSEDSVPKDDSRRDFTSALPAELCLKIMSLADAPTLAIASRVSRAWKVFAQDQSVWRSAFLRKYQRQIHTDPAPIQVGSTGCGRKNKRHQPWKNMYKARVHLEAQWRMGPKESGKATYLSGHTDSVYCVQFDEEKIITGSRDRTIRVWDINTLQCIKVIGGPQVRPAPGPKPLRTVDYPSFHSAVASVNGTVYGNGIFTTPEQWHDASILCLQYDDKILVTGSSDSTLLVWDIKTYKPMRRLTDHTGGVLDVALDAKYIVSCSKDSSIIVWNRSDYSIKGRLPGHRGPVNAVQLRGRFLVSASGDGIARLWDIEKMTLVKEFSAKERGLAAVEFSEDMKYVLAGGNDHITYKFCVETGEEVGRFTGHTQLVRSLWLDSANSRVVSGSYDLDLRVYDFNTGEQIWRAEEWTTSWMLAAKSDYRRIVATSQDGRILIIDFGLRKDPTARIDGMPIDYIDDLREIPIEETTAIVFATRSPTSSTAGSDNSCRSPTPHQFGPPTLSAYTLSVNASNFVPWSTRIAQRASRA